MVPKGKQVKATELQDAQTQPDVAVRTETRTPHSKANSNKSSGKLVQPSDSSLNSPIKNNKNNKITNKSSEQVLSDRLPKGSDDPHPTAFIYNSFHCLDEDMEAESAPAESTNKQRRIIKLNKK